MQEEIIREYLNLTRLRLKLYGSIHHLKQEICYLRMHLNFIVPTSVQHRDFQMEIR